MMRSFLIMLMLFSLTTRLGAQTQSEGLPIKEVTVFKDGHALVMRSGSAAIDDAGDVRLTELPRPVMGTFWAQSDTPAAELKSVRVERVETEGVRPVRTMADVLAANVGRVIEYRTRENPEARSGRLKEILGGDGAGGTQPIAVLRWNRAYEFAPVSSMYGVRFENLDKDEQPVTQLPLTTQEERMTLDLAWERTPGANAEVSLMYLQRGLRWIPSYRVTMLDDDRVRLELQATLVNELADLDDVTLHLAIGVPTFAFDHTPDPMALRDSFNQLGLFFQQAQRGRTGAMLSNALMSQRARMTEMHDAGGGGGGTASPEVTGGDRTEDLFVFSVEGVSLSRGARMVVPITSFECDAASVYRLDLPASPHDGASNRFNTQQQRQIAQMLDRPTAKHMLRIKHEHPLGYPITTAPALVVRDGVTLAQGLITYTPSGGSVDLEVGSALDIRVDVQEDEVSRDPKGLRWRNDDYARIGLEMRATLTNRKAHSVRVEVRRLAFGTPDSVNQDGEMRTLSVFSAEGEWGSYDSAWWRTYSWPFYWHAINGAAEFRWDVELEPGEEMTLEAAWHYFWR